MAIDLVQSKLEYLGLVSPPGNPTYISPPPARLQLPGGATAIQDHMALVVDGRTLAYILDDKEQCTQFLRLALACGSVICCRATPDQKVRFPWLWKSFFQMNIILISYTLKLTLFIPMCCLIYCWVINFSLCDLKYIPIDEIILSTSNSWYRCNAFKLHIHLSPCDLIKSVCDIYVLYVSPSSCNVHKKCFNFW